MSLIGEGLPASGGGSRRPDRAGRRGVGNAGQRRRTRFEHRLAASHGIELLLVLLLIEQLPARHAVDLAAQFRDAILIGILHLGLAGDQAGEEVVAKSKIGRGHDRPRRHHHQGADEGPKRDRPDAELTPGMGERVVGGRRVAAVGPLAVEAEVRALAMMSELFTAMATRFRPVRHWRSRAGPLFVGPADNSRHLGGTWLTFCKLDREKLLRCLDQPHRAACWSALAAARTASAWPGTFTFFQICAIRPSGPIRKVVRKMPI